MALPTKHVRVRRIAYSLLAQPLAEVLYDDHLRGTNVLDPALSENPQVRITNYTFNIGKYKQVHD